MLYGLMRAANIHSLLYYDVRLFPTLLTEEYDRPEMTSEKVKTD